MSDDKKEGSKKDMPNFMDPNDVGNNYMTEESFKLYKSFEDANGRIQGKSLSKSMPLPDVDIGQAMFARLGVALVLERGALDGLGEMLKEAIGAQKRVMNGRSDMTGHIVLPPETAEQVQELVEQSCKSMELATIFMTALRGQVEQLQDEVAFLKADTPADFNKFMGIGGDDE